MGAGWASSAFILGIFLRAAAGVENMKVSLGKEFTVALEAKPSTGYAWEANYDSHFLTLKEHGFETLAPKGPEAALPLGAPGRARFTFIPIKAGQTTIKMVYQRPWEQSPAQEKAFMIIIRGEGS
jgi:predicted secreted protein